MYTHLYLCLLQNYVDISPTYWACYEYL